MMQQTNMTDGNSKEGQRRALERVRGQRFQCKPSRMAIPSSSTHAVYGGGNGNEPNVAIGIEDPPGTRLSTNNDGDDGIWSNTGRRSIFTRKTMKEERALHKLQNMQQRFDRLSQDATTGTETDFIDATFEAGCFGDAEEIFDVVSSLQEMNDRNERNIEQLQRQLDECTRERDAALHSSEILASKNESILAEVKLWKDKYRHIEKLRYELVGKMATKVLAESLDWKHKQKSMQQQNAELKDTIGNLSNENEQLVTVQQSMEEAMELASGMDKKMEQFIQVHEATVRGYEERIILLNNELQQVKLSKDELSTDLYETKKENRTLHVCLKEANDIENYYEQQLVEMNAACDAMEYERDEAIRRCKEVLVKEGENEEEEGKGERVNATRAQQRQQTNGEETGGHF